MMTELTPAQLESVSAASQRLAAYALKEPVARLQTLTAALVGVCQSNAIQTEEAANLIRSAVRMQRKISSLIHRQFIS